MRAAIRAVFRHDRVTGQIALGLAGVLGVSAAVFGVGVDSARYDLADVGAWLSADNKGMAVHANGPAGRVDGKADLIPMRGYTIGYLIGTPGSWKEFAGPTVWQC